MEGRILAPTPRGPMNTEQFFQMVLPSSGRKCLVAMTPDGPRHRWFSSIPEMAQAAAILTNSKMEVFYGLSGYEPDPTGKYRRRGMYAKYVKSFWLDLDVGADKPYATQVDAVTAVVKQCSTYKIPRPVLVSSGYGVHAYWPLPKEITPEQWSPIASSLKQLMPALGIQIGVERTGDIASILRPVGCMNFKRGGTAPVELLWEPSDPKGRARQFVEAVQLQAQARSILPNITVGSVRAPSGINNALMSIHDNRPVDANKIAERCAWMRNARDNPGDLSEPAWYSMIGLLKFCETADEVVQQWSVGHPGYSERETAEKLDHAQRSGTPPTLCTTLESYNAAPCKGCKHKGDIKTPLVLGRTVPAAATDILNGYTHRELVQPPVPYRIDNYGGIWKDGEDSTLLYPYPIMLTARSRDIAGREYYTYSVGREDKSWVELDVKAADLASQNDCIKGFASIGVNGFPHGELMHYARSFAEDMKQRQKAAGIYERLGWQPDQSFVGPGARYQVGHEPEPVLFTPSTSTITRHLNKAGTLEAWYGAVKELGRSPAHAMGFLMGYAAPLVELSGYNGFMVNLYGGTGVGKSAVQEAAATIYGPWDKLHLRAADTINATFTMAGVLSALPLLIEEITTMGDRELASLVYSATEGRPKLRAQRDGALVESNLAWATTFVTSTNRSIADMLPTGQTVTQEALLARILEVELTGYSASVDDGHLEVAHLRDIHLVGRDNYGHAGEIWLNYVVHNRDLLKREIQQFQDAIAGEWKVDRAAGRFWLAAIALALVAAKHTTKLGLFELADPVAFKDWLRTQYGAMEGMREQSGVNLSQRLGYFLDEHTKYTVSVKPSSDGKWSAFGIPMAGTPVYVRQELDHLGNLQTIAISATRLFEWCKTQGWSFNEVKKWMGDAGLLQSTTMVRMERGMLLESGQRKTRCFVLNGAHPLFRTVTVVKNDAAQEGINVRVG